MNKYVPQCVLFSLLLLLHPGAVSACFDPTATKCNGTTPRVDPETYFCMVRANLKNKLISKDFVQFVDKLLFKEYCKSKNVTTAKTLAVYEQADYRKVNFDAYLPNYVLKSNKATKRVVVVKNNTVIGKGGGPLNEKRKHKLNHTISTWGQPALISAESFYDFTEPKIFIEEFLDPLPDDIKIYTVDNHVDTIRINSRTATNFYDADMNKLPYVRHNRPEIMWPSVADALKADPSKLAKLHSIAVSMASDVALDLVRVDLFLIGDEFYGGELTLSSGAGHDTIHHVDLNPKGFDVKRTRPCILGDHMYYKSHNNSLHRES